MGIAVFNIYAENLVRSSLNLLLLFLESGPDRIFWIADAIAGWNESQYQIK